MVVHPGALFRRRVDGQLDGVRTLQRMSKEAKLGTVQVVRSASVHTPWVHEDDVGDLFALVLERGARGGIYNCTGFVQTIESAANAAAAAVGVEKFELVSVDGDSALRQFGAVGAFGYALDVVKVDCSNSETLGWKAGHLQF